MPTLLRSPLQSALRKSVYLVLEPRSSGGAVNPYAAFNAFVQGLYTGGETGIWYDGTDPTQRAVNSDGSGGVPAAGAKFGWLNDKTGGGKPAIQATSGSQPIAQSNYVLFQHQDAITVGDPRRFLKPASGSGANQQACSGIMICDTQIAPFDAIPVTGWNYAASNTGYPCRYAFIAWRTNSVGSMDLYICDINYSGTPSGAIPTTAQRAPEIGCGTTMSSKQMLFYQYVQFNSRLSDSNWNQLRSLASAACGAASLTTDAVVIQGDSNVEGYRLTDGKPWPWTVAGSINAKVYNVGVSATIMRNEVGKLQGSSGYLTVMAGSGKNVLLPVLGINDMSFTNYTDIADMYATFFYAARMYGWRTIAATYYNNQSQMASFHSVMTPRIGDSHDHLADFIADPGLSDRTNLACFRSDQLHLNEGGALAAAAVAVPVIQAALAKPFANFTATPRQGSSVNATFTNTSVGGTSRAWDFTNDGSTDSTSTSPSNTYGSNGTPDVKLVETNASGSTTRIRRYYINVNNAPSWVTSNLVAGFIKNAGITQAGGLVSAWADTLTASGISLVQATVANQPSVDGSGIVTFDGSNDFLQAATIAALSGEFSVFLRGRINTWTAGRVLWDGNNSTTFYAALQASNRITTTDSVGTLALNQGPGAGVTMSFHGGNPACSVLTKVIMTKLEGMEPIYGQWGGEAAMGGFTLGARYNGTNPVAMSVDAVLIYSAGLTRAQWAQNEAMAATL